MENVFLSRRSVSGRNGEVRASCLQQPTWLVECCKFIGARVHDEDEEYLSKTERLGLQLPFIRALQPGTLQVSGMFNIGNTCFLNALLQAISSCEELTKYICFSEFSARKNDSCCFMRPFSHVSVINPKQDLFNELRRTILRLQVLRSKETPVAICTKKLYFKINLAWQRLQDESFQQQDSDELFYKILELADENVSYLVMEMNRHKAISMWKSNASESKYNEHEGVPLLANKNSPKAFFYTPRNPLHGTYIREKVCLGCGFSSPWVLSPFRMLILPTIDMKNNRYLHSLNECLIKFCAEELINDIYCNSIHCNGKRRSMLSRLSIGRPPQTLVLHLRRLQYDVRSGGMTKLRHHISFPMGFDFSKYSVLQRMSGLNQALPESTSRTCDVPEERCTMFYDLHALLVHHGNAFGGHYTAYRRLSENIWVHANDSHVSRVTEDDVKQSEAYMLFYERRKHATSML